jgi:quinoprotein glucose dehydrogenase
MMPGWAGGSSWAGAAFDPETRMAYITSVTYPLQIRMTNATPEIPHPLIGRPSPMETMDGIPVWKPPYGRITAIDLSSGEHSWMVPLGDLSSAHEELRKLNLPPTGRPSRGHMLLTKTMLIVGQEGNTQRSEGGSREFVVYEPKLEAFDKQTGTTLGEVALPRNATAAPITYMVDGKQYIAVATGGADMPAELVVLSLPE